MKRIFRLSLISDWKELVIFVLLFILVISLSHNLLWKYNDWKESKRIKEDINIYKLKILFLKKYLPEDASISLLKWSKKYGLDWKKVLSTIYSESEGKKNAVGRTRDYGYMQLLRPTARNAKIVLRKYYSKQKQKIFRKSNYIFDTDFNIGGGCLLLHWIKNTVLNGKGCWVDIITIYNVGIGNFRKGKRNWKHVKKWGMLYSFFKTEWKDFIGDINVKDN